MLVALAPIYYLLPHDLPVVGLRRWVLLIVFFAGIALFEAWRQSKGFTFLGLRPHERHQIASFVWAAAGITIALWLFPYDIASAVLVGMGLIDPLAGEFRRVRGRCAPSITVPMVFYFFLSMSVLGLFGWRDAGTVAALSAVGAVSAVLSECLHVRHVDDDFLMIVVPGALMIALALLL